MLKTEPIFKMPEGPKGGWNADGAIKCRCGQPAAMRYGSMVWCTGHLPEDIKRAGLEYVDEVFERCLKERLHKNALRKTIAMPFYSGHQRRWIGLPTGPKQQESNPSCPQSI